jgi:hypothetical protein
MTAEFAKKPLAMQEQPTDAVSQALGCHREENAQEDEGRET